MIRLKTAVVLAPLLTLRDAGLVSNWWFLGTGVDASLEVSAGARILVQFRWDTRSEFISWRCTSWLGLEAVIHFVFVVELIGGARFRIVDGVDVNRLLDLAILVPIILAGASVAAIALATTVCAVSIVAVGLARTGVIVVILCSRRLFRLWTFGGADQGTAAVGGALTHLNLVIHVVALYGEGHWRAFGHTLTSMDMTTDRVFDGDLCLTVSRYVLADVNVGQLGRVHGELDWGSYWVLETEVDR